VPPGFRGFGAVPVSADNLLRIALIRESAHVLYMTEVKGKDERIKFTFKPDAPLQVENIQKLLMQYKDKMTFTAYGAPFLTYRYKKAGIIEKDAQQLLATTEELLEKMKEVLLST